MLQPRKYLEEYEKAKESGQPLSNDHVRIALQAKRLPGLPIDESDYAGLQANETCAGIEAVPVSIGSFESASLIVTK